MNWFRRWCWHRWVAESMNEEGVYRVCRKCGRRVFQPYPNDPGPIVVPFGMSAGRWVHPVVVLPGGHDNGAEQSKQRDEHDSE